MDSAMARRDATIDVASGRVTEITAFARSNSDPRPVAPLYAFGATFILLKLMSFAFRLRVTEREEAIGLDVTQHGEEAYVSGEGAILIEPHEGDHRAQRVLAGGRGYHLAVEGEQERVDRLGPPHVHGDHEVLLPRVDLRVASTRRERVRRGDAVLTVGAVSPVRVDPVPGGVRSLAGGAPAGLGEFCDPARTEAQGRGIVPVGAGGHDAQISLR